MSITAHGKKDNAIQVLVFVLVLLILGLTAINIKNYLAPIKVLGASTKNGYSNVPDEKAFWDDFLAKNPNYIPGWTEVGNTDKVRQIDPNY